jgi:hypothetical protein
MFFSFLQGGKLVQATYVIDPPNPTPYVPDFSNAINIQVGQQVSGSNTSLIGGESYAFTSSTTGVYIITLSATTGMIPELYDEDGLKMYGNKNYSSTSYVLYDDAKYHISVTGKGTYKLSVNYVNETASIGNFSEYFNDFNVNSCGINTEFGRT